MSKVQNGESLIDCLISESDILVVTILMVTKMTDKTT